MIQKSASHVKKNNEYLHDEYTHAFFISFQVFMSKNFSCLSIFHVKRFFMSKNFSCQEFSGGKIFFLRIRMVYIFNPETANGLNSKIDFN